MESVKVNHIAISLTITELVANQDKIDKIVEKTVYSKTYWNNLSKLIEILKELIIKLAYLKVILLSYFIFMNDNKLENKLYNEINIKLDNELDNESNDKLNNELNNELDDEL
ncbi:28945_t:CDS:2, partial [Gigaspora margarita]